jgi:hypothetical protein
MALTPKKLQGRLRVLHTQFMAVASFWLELASLPAPRVSQFHEPARPFGRRTTRQEDKWLILMRVIL